MFRKLRLRGAAKCRFPRIRGDVPLKESKTQSKKEFSPHTRGCSDPIAGGLDADKVFPAYAGMFRPCRSFMAYRKRFPRIRGDVPVTTGVL